MIKKIKIIDILCYISTGEFDKVPKKIRYDNKIMEYDNHKQDYKGYYSNNNGNWLFQYLFDKCRNTLHFINDFVEILDEEDEFEDIGEIIYPDLNKDYEFELHHKHIEEIYDTINQLIKNQKKIIERLKDE